VLGYRLEPRNGYKTSVHVKPWSKRTKRFKNKLAIKLEKAEPGADLFAIAEGYRVNWFNSQSAWTKVPQIMPSRRRQPVNPSSRCYSGVWRVERSEIQSRMLGLPAPGNWSVCRSDGARREAVLSGTLAVGSLTTP
jgi:hypothetical protein